MPPFDTLPTGQISIGQAIDFALGCLNFGRLDLCDHVCDRVLQVDPANIRARVVRGLSAHRRRDNARAVAVLADVVRDTPEFADARHHLGIALAQLGRTGPAEAAFRRALCLEPAYPEPMAALGEIHRTRHPETAFPLFKRALMLKFNYSPAYIGYSSLCFERSRPPGTAPFARRERRTDRPLLTMASLGNYGRFTQTVNEYVAVRLYAEKYGQEFATPDWLGHSFFTLDDPLLEPTVQAEAAEWLTLRETFAAGFTGTVDTPFRDRDLFLGGSPVNPMVRSAQDRIRSWLTPRPCWAGFLDPAIGPMRARGRTLVAIHIRQTDWWDRKYTPLALYRTWLEQTWSGLDDPVLFVSTDEPSVIGAFAPWNPMTSADIPVRWEGLEYLQDFHVLTQADVLAISTGGFAATAAALNRNARLFLKPSADESTLEAYDPWTD